MDLNHRRLRLQRSALPLSYPGLFGADGENRTRAASLARMLSAIDDTSARACSGEVDAGSRQRTRATKNRRRQTGGCGMESNLHSIEAPGYSRLGFPVPYTPVIWRRAEVLIPTPCGAIPLRTGAGAPVRLALQAKWRKAEDTISTPLRGATRFPGGAGPRPVSLPLS